MLRCLGAGWIVVSALGAALCGQSQDRALEPSSEIEEKLAGSEQRIYALDLAPNQTLPITITERQGMAGIVSILAADGSELAEADLGRRSPSAKMMLIPPGASQLILRPAHHSTVERVFQVRTGAYHPLDERDRQRIEADRLLGQGERAFREKAPGFREAALAAYQKSLGIWTQLGDRSREADALCHIGNAQQELDDMKHAADTYQRALDLSNTENDRAGQAAALYGKAVVADETGDLPNAEKWATQALEIRQSLGNQRGQIENLIVLFEVRYVRGKRDEARTTAELALSLAQKTGDRLGEAEARDSLGVLESQLGNPTAAIAHYAASLAIARDENDPMYTATGLSNLAAGHAELGDYREAVQFFEQALPLRKVFSSPSSYANTLYNVAVVHTTLGDYEQALAGFREALSIFQQTHFARGEGFALLQIGRLYLTTGETDQAEDYLRQAAAKWRSASDRNDEVRAAESLAQLAIVRGDFPKSIQLATDALAMAQAAGLQIEEERTQILLARAELASGNARRSLEHANAARELSVKISDQAGAADAAYQQGAAWRKLGDAMMARDNLKAALAQHKQTERKLNQVQDLEELARLDRDRGEADEALVLLDTLGPAAGRVESRMQFSASHRELFDLAIDLHMQSGDPSGAFELSERARARGLATLLREPAVNVREGAAIALVTRERDLESSMDGKQERLTRMLAGPHDASKTAEARAELDRVVTQYRDVQAEIRKNSPRYAALIAPRTLSAAETQAELRDPETALVEYWLGSEHSYVWLVTKNAVQGFVLPAHDAIETVARRAYAALDARNVEREETLGARKQRVSDADHDFAQLAEALSKMLIGPIHGLAGIRRLWVVSDGALEYLPFAALPAPDTQRPLVAMHEIVRLPSASVMAEMRSEASERRPAPLRVAVFADPVFRADDERVANVAVRQATDAPRAASDVDLFNLPRLYFSRQEADAIRTLAGGRQAREILDFDASRAEAEKPTLRDYRVVHFATHALLDSKNPELSGLVLSMIDRQGRPQDGFLRLHEIYNLKLKADLVVLSACRTALGAEVQSEGLIGLTRGFMYAGAPQVLASLWSIRDNATTWFMTQFYEALLERHQTPEAALRDAQLAMIKDPRWNQPYYWAAFTVQGAR
jgi:CHAT domain-containing protein